MAPDTKRRQQCDGCGDPLDTPGDYLCADCREEFEQKFEETREERRRWLDENRTEREPRTPPAGGRASDAVMRLVELAVDLFRRGELPE